MTGPDRDLTRAVRSWLRGNGHEDADRVLFAVLQQIDTTPQRQAGWLARRFPIMNSTTVRFGLAAVVVILVAMLGFQLLPGANLGGPAETASPTPTPSAEPSQSWLSDGLGSGRVDATIDGVEFSFVAPSGWSRTEFDGMIRGRALGQYFPWIAFLNRFDSVATDPCAGEATRVGPTVDDLATALTTIPGINAEAPVDTTVAGLPAKLVVLTLEDEIGCSPSSFWLYGDESAYPNSTNSTIRVWIFELNGTRYSIHTDADGPSEEVAQEIQQIIDSIRFE
jgi:hypothetical protein